jgi:hypothetical protein
LDGQAGTGRKKMGFTSIHRLGCSTHLTFNSLWSNCLSRICISGHVSHVERWARIHIASRLPMRTRLELHGRKGLVSMME